LFNFCLDLVELLLIELYGPVLMVKKMKILPGFSENLLRIYQGIPDLLVCWPCGRRCVRELVFSLFKERVLC
jgi:hypothetical protein